MAIVLVCPPRQIQSSRRKPGITSKALSFPVQVSHQARLFNSGNLEPFGSQEAKADALAHGEDYRVKKYPHRNQSTRKGPVDRTLSKSGQSQSQRICWQLYSNMKLTSSRSNSHRSCRKKILLRLLRRGSNGSCSNRSKTAPTSPTATPLFSHERILPISNTASAKEILV